MNVNSTAATTATLCAATTICTTLMAANAVSTIALIAYSILAITSCAISVASVTAWIDKTAKDPKSYFNTLSDHCKFAIAAIYQLIAHTLVQALIEGIAQGITTNVRRRIAGPDLTTAHRS